MVRAAADETAVTAATEPDAGPGGAGSDVPRAGGAQSAAPGIDAAGSAIAAGGSAGNVTVGADAPDPPPPDITPPELSEALPDDRFLNRELSWLDFNARVLSLAENPSTPLLERANFLAIFANNLDEFYMVRVAGLKRRQQMGLPSRSPDGLSTREQLDLIAERSADLVARHARCFVHDVLPALAAKGVQIVSWADLAAGERDRMRDYFRDQVFPVLTPLAVDPAHPFPYISGLSLNLAVVVRDPDGGPELFARVKVPNNVPRLVRVSAGDARGVGSVAASGETRAAGTVGSVGEPRTAGTAAPRGIRFLPLEELIAAHLDQLFSGMQIVEQYPFRVTRNAEVEVEEDRDEDLLQALERELARRRFGPPVRLEVAATASDHVLELLVRELDMDGHDVVRVPGLLDLSALWQVYGEVDRPDLKNRPFVPATHPRFAEGETPRSVFATLRDGDILVHHPYHSFSTSVQRFIEQAAADPSVLAIKQTLYRTSGDSPVVDALIDAAEAGKQVVVLVEIKARFDEVANIGWARKLERAGCHVVYGLVGLKTHCKIALVVRQEGNQIRRYAHIGTGNYHPKTARLYEDLGLLTADPEVGADLTDLFNVLTGYSLQTAYRRLLVAPHGVRAGIIERIERETKKAADGRPALVQIKVNSLVDEQVVDALYRASQTGVHVDLIVRGICTLRPGVPGLSEHIRVRSILGRFLEHSRVFRFGAGATGTAAGAATEYWIGSADLMHRNLDRRVEALVQVSNPTARAELEALLALSMRETTSAFELQPDGTWQAPDDAGGGQHLQTALLRKVVDRAG